MKDIVFYPVIIGIALLSGFEVIDAVKREGEPYMAMRSVVYLEGERKIQQSPSVQGIGNMPAGWQAAIYAGDVESALLAGESPKPLCAGGSGFLKSSYVDQEVATFSPSVWTGGDCPDVLPMPWTLRGVWTYESNGAVHQHVVIRVVRERLVFGTP